MENININIITAVLAYFLQAVELTSLSTELEVVESGSSLVKLTELTGTSNNDNIKNLHQ